MVFSIKLKKRNESYEILPHFWCLCLISTYYILLLNKMLLISLCFKCEVKDLEAAFDTFGELTDISIPTKTGSKWHL